MSHSNNNLRTSLLAVLLGSVTALMLVLNGAISNGDLDLSRWAGAQTQCPAGQIEHMDPATHLPTGTCKTPAEECVSQFGTWNGVDTCTTPDGHTFTLQAPGTTTTTTGTTTTTQPAATTTTTTTQPAATTGTTTTTTQPAATTTTTTQPAATSTTTTTTTTAPPLATSEADCWAKGGTWGKHDGITISCQIDPAVACAKQSGRLVGDKCWIASAVCTAEKAKCVDNQGVFNPDGNDSLIIDKAIVGKCNEVLCRLPAGTDTPNITCTAPSFPTPDYLNPGQWHCADDTEIRASQCSRSGKYPVTKGTNNGMQFVVCADSLDPAALKVACGNDKYEIHADPKTGKPAGVTCFSGAAPAPQPVPVPQPISDPSQDELKCLKLGGNWDGKQCLPPDKIDDGKIDCSLVMCPAVMPPECGPDEEYFIEPDSCCNIGECRPRRDKPHFDQKQFERDKHFFRKDVERMQKEMNNQLRQVQRDVTRMERDLQRIPTQDPNRRHLEQEIANRKQEQAGLQEMVKLYADLLVRLDNFDPTKYDEPWRALEKMRKEVELVQMKMEAGRREGELANMVKQAVEFQVRDKAAVVKIIADLEGILNSSKQRIVDLTAKLAAAQTQEDWQEIYDEWGEFWNENNDFWPTLNELRWEIDDARDEFFQKQATQGFQQVYDAYLLMTDMIVGFVRDAGYDVGRLEAALQFPRPWFDKAARAASEGRFEDIDRIMESMPAEEFGMRLAKALIPIVDPLADDVLAGKFDQQLDDLLQQARNFITAIPPQERPFPIEEFFPDVEMIKEGLRQGVAEARQQYGSLAKAIQTELRGGFGGGPGAGLSTTTDRYAGEFDADMQEKLNRHGLAKKDIHREWAPYAKDARFKEFVDLADDPELVGDVTSNLEFMAGFDKQMVSDLLELKKEIISLRAELTTLKGENVALRAELDKVSKLNELASRAPLTKEEGKKISGKLAEAVAAADIMDKAEYRVLVEELKKEIKTAVASSVDELWQKGQIAFTDLPARDTEGDASRDFTAFNGILTEAKEAGIFRGVDAEGKRFEPARNISRAEAGKLALRLAAGEDAVTNLPQVGWEKATEKQLAAEGIAFKLNNQPIKRGEYFDLMAKAADWDEDAAGLGKDCFKDATNEATCLLKARGVIQGAGDLVKAGEALNRAEAAKVVTGVLEQKETMAGVIAE